MLIQESTIMNFVSRSMLHWSALLLLCMFCLLPGGSIASRDSEQDLSSGTVDPLHPRRLQETNPPFIRHLSQSARSDDEDEEVCDLTSSQRRRFYNASSHAWIVTDEVLEELDNDLQSIVACTKQDDFIFFSTERRIKPRKSITIQRRLTLSAQPQGSLFRDEVIAEIQRKMAITCPDEGDLLTVRRGSIMISNIIFTDCNRTGNVAVVDIRCDDLSTRGVIQLVHTEFRNHVVSDDQRLLKTVDPSCAEIVMEDVVIRENKCESACMSLSLNNTLTSIRLRRNQGGVNDISRVNRAVFMLPLGSESVATNMSASRNQVRLFSIVNSSFTLRESVFNRNTMRPVDQHISESVGGTIFFSNSSKVRISDSVFVKNSGWNGGAVFASASVFNISNCTFNENNADIGNGGAFYAMNGSFITLSRCTFSNNNAILGAGIFSYQSTSVHVIDSRFLDNNGTSGAGLYIVNGDMTIESCEFRQNRVSFGGGALMLSDVNASILNSTFLKSEAGNGGGINSFGNTLLIRDTNFTKNVAIRDGGGCYFDNANATLRNLIFRRNRANNGGGLYVNDVDRMTLVSTIFEENEANRFGGGARVAAASGVQSFDNCGFVRNTAEEGGCLAGSRAELRITNMLCEDNNAAIRGGGLVFDNCAVTMDNTGIISSQARNFSGILATNSSQIVARNLSLSLSIAVDDGGGIGVLNGSSLLCSRCKFQHNMATRGAGLFIETDDSSPLVAQLQDSFVLNNSALTYGGNVQLFLKDPTIDDICLGGMLFIRPQNVSINCNARRTICSRVSLLNTDFQNNSAGQSGGAVLTTDPEGVLISCTQQRRQNVFLEPGQISSLEVINPMSLCSSWRGNQVARNAPGDTIGTFGRVLSLSVEPNEDIQIIGDVHSGFVLENVSSGVQLPVIFVTALDAYGNGPLTTNPDPLEARIVSADEVLPATITAKIVNGSGNFSNFVGFMPPGNYSLIIVPNSISLPSTKLVIHVRGCQIGEEPTQDRVLCQECDALSFNFNPERSGGCTPCPSDATCKHRFIIPKDGYWHKGPCHASVKECLTDEACSYKERQDRLGNFTENFHDCKFNQTTLMEYSNVSCREGYERPLCGSCAGGYGLSLGFKCSKCPSDFETLITLLLFTVYLLAISSITIRGGLPISLGNTRATVLTTSAPIHEVVREEQQQEVEINFEMVKMMRDGYVPPEYFQQKKASNSNCLLSQELQEQQQSQEVELTRWVTTEIFKILINFLQMTAVAAAINVRWTEGVLIMFEASEYMGALTTAALSRPIDCLVSSSSAAVRSIWRTLLSLFVPSAVMVIFASFWGIIAYRQSRGLSYFWKRVTLSIVAVTYISYLGLTKLAVRVFYCVDVYDSDSAETESQDKVWAVDTSIQCYEKEHSGLIGIAVLILVLVSFSFPLISAVILSRNKDKHRDSSSWTMETMGFLYRAFKEEYVFWESLVMLRKAFLSIIVVFSYPLGGQAQGVLALVVLVFSQYLHFTILPYRKEFQRLNSYESGSLLVSSMIFILSQLFNVEQSSDSTRVLVAVIIVAMNTLFFIFLLIVLFRSGIVHLKALLKSEDHAVNENAFWWVVLALYVKSRTNKWTHARN